MKKIYFLSFLLLGILVNSEAQTKLIAHKSHSGNLNHFKIALEGNLFDMKASDFGDPGWTEEKHRLDSLVKIDDATVIMYVTHFCKWGYNDKDTLKVCDTYNRRMTHTEFSEAKYEEEILALLEKNTQFDFPLSETKLIGYSKKKLEEQKEIPSNFPNQSTNNEQGEIKIELKKKVTKKELRKEKRALKKAKKKAKKIGEVEEKKETKVCTKPKIVMPVFIEEQIVEKEEIEKIVSGNQGRHWLAVIGLGLFSLLLGGFAQFLKMR